MISVGNGQNSLKSMQSDDVVFCHISDDLTPKSIIYLLRATKNYIKNNKSG